MKKKIVFGLFSLIFLFLFALPVFAKIDILSYCDVSLESCRAQDQALSILQEKYPHDISVDYLYYFDTNNAKSSMAQIAVECANKQGMKEEYKLYIEEHLEDLSKTALKSYAESVGLVAMNFTFCLDTQATAWEVLDQVTHAEEDSVIVAPSTRFNMELYSGSETYTSLHTRVLEYLGLSDEDSEAMSEKSKEYENKEYKEYADDKLEDKTEELDDKAEEISVPTQQSYEEEKEVEATLTLEEREDPLFFRVIGQFRQWLLTVFAKS